MQLTKIIPMHHVKSEPRYQIQFYCLDQLVDSFKVRAQNSLKNNYNQGKIDRHPDYIDNRIGEYEKALDQSDSDDEKAELSEKIQAQKVRKSKYESLEAALKATGKEQISTTDKDAQSVVLHRHITQVGYNVQASVDITWLVVPI